MPWSLRTESDFESGAGALGGLTSVCGARFRETSMGRSHIPRPDPEPMQPEEAEEAQPEEVPGPVQRLGVLQVPVRLTLGLESGCLIPLAQNSPAAGLLNEAAVKPAFQWAAVLARSRHPMAGFVAVARPWRPRPARSLARRAGCAFGWSDLKPSVRETELAS